LLAQAEREEEASPVPTPSGLRAAPEPSETSGSGPES